MTRESKKRCPSHFFRYINLYFIIFDKIRLIIYKFYVKF